MSSSYARPSSPGGRRGVPAGRTSLTTYVAPPYSDASGVIRSTRDVVPATRTGAERADAPRVMPVRQRSPPRRVRDDDDYTVRPRRTSLVPAEAGSRRPLSMIAPRSPNRSVKPIITRDLDRPSSPLAKSSTSGGVQLEASYIIPSSSSAGRHHHRHSSLTGGEQLRIKDKDSRAERSYPASSRALAPRQNPREDREYVEYTGPRKEFERDLAPLPVGRDRSSSYSMGRARPTSALIPDRREPEYQRLTRNAAPSTADRDVDVIRRTEGSKPHRSHGEHADRRDAILRPYGREDREPRYRDINRVSRRGEEDDYIPYPEERHRHHRDKKSTVDDDSSDGRHRHRRHEEDRPERGEERTRRRHDRDETREDERRWSYDKDEDPDRRVRDDRRERRDQDEDKVGGKGVLAGVGAAAAGMAAAGVAGEVSRRHRGKESREEAKDPRYLREPERIRADGSETTSLSDEIRPNGAGDEDREERRRRRRLEKEREDREYREAQEYDRRTRDGRTGSTGEDGRNADARALAVTGQDEPGLRERKSYERRPSNQSQDQRRHPNDDAISDTASASSFRDRERDRGKPNTREDRAVDDDEDLDDDSDDERRYRDREPPRVVTPSPEDTRPSNSNQPRPPPKGILKKAREKFPEEPGTIREGVAPLDAARRGIPADARWTRINRRLVNPEALEADGVRFEEGPDFVIVLKVLNQEEITRYAQKTHEIRERRRRGMDGGSGGDDGGDPAPGAAAVAGNSSPASAA